MTIQFEILTKSRGYSTDDGGIHHNPFFNRSLEEVKNNLDQAKRVYSDIIKCHNSTHIIVHGRPIPQELWVFEL